MKDPQCKEKESEIVSSVLQTGVDNPTETLKSETDCRTLETDAEKLTEAVKSETVSDGGTEKTEVEADGESKKEETETGDGTGTAEAIADKESAEKTQMDTSEKKGKWGLKKWPLPFEDDLDKIDIPFPESCSKSKTYVVVTQKNHFSEMVLWRTQMMVKHLTVTIGPIYLGDLQSQELLSVLSMNRKFEIKFDYDEEDDDEETFGRPKSGIVRIPLKVKTPTFFLLIYNKLSSLVIGGRDMSVKFPEQFNVALEDAKKWREQKVHALMAMRMRQFEEKRRRIRVKNLPNTVTTDTIKALFPEALNVELYQTEVADTMGAYITFKTRAEAKKCVEDTKDMTVEDRKVRLQLNVFKDETTMAQFFHDMKERGPAGRKRKRGPKQGGGPAKREDLKRDATKMVEAIKESSKANTKPNNTGNVAGKAGGQRQGERRLSSNNASRSRSKRNPGNQKSTLQFRNSMSYKGNQYYGLSQKGQGKNRPGLSQKGQGKNRPGRMGNQLGMNLANRAMNMNQGMMGSKQRMSPGSQGQFNAGELRSSPDRGERGTGRKNGGGAVGMNKGNRGTMQRMSPGSQGGGQFNAVSEMRSNPGGDEEGTRQKRRRVNRGGALGLSDDEEEDPRAMLVSLKRKLTKMEEKIAKQSSPQKYDKVDSGRGSRQSRMVKDKPTNVSDRTGSRFSDLHVTDDRYRNTPRSGYEKITSSDSSSLDLHVTDDRYRNTPRSGYEKMTSSDSSSLDGGTSSTGNATARRIISVGEGSYRYGSQGSAGQNFGSSSTPSYQILRLVGDQNGQSHGISQSNLGYGSGQSNQGLLGQSSQGFVGQPSQDFVGQTSHGLRVLTSQDFVGSQSGSGSLVLAGQTSQGFGGQTSQGFGGQTGQGLVSSQSGLGYQVLGGQNSHGFGGQTRQGFGGQTSQSLVSSPSGFGFQVLGGQPSHGYGGQTTKPLGTVRVVQVLGGQTIQGLSGQTSQGFRGSQSGSGSQAQSSRVGFGNQSGQSQRRRRQRNRRSRFDR